MNMKHDFISNTVFIRIKICLHLMSHRQSPRLQQSTVSLKLMTHSPEISAETRRRAADFWSLDCVSYRSGTRFFWYQILAPVGCMFYIEPISGMHA